MPKQQKRNRGAKKHRTTKRRGNTQNNRQPVPSPLRFKIAPGYNDSYGATMPMSYSLQAGAPFWDYQFATTANTTAAQQSVLAPLMTNILAAFPQTTIPVIQGTTVTWYQEIRITDILVSIDVIGSQSNTIVAGDLFNRLRSYLFWTGKSYSTTNVNPASASSYGSWPLMQDVDRILLDINFDLPSVSFDSTSATNTPMVRTYRARLPVNRTLECFTSVAAGTSGWDTKEYDLIVAHQSDSSVLPNPQIIYNLRCYYDIVRR